MAPPVDSPRKSRKRTHFLSASSATCQMACLGGVIGNRWKLEGNEKSMDGA